MTAIIIAWPLKRSIVARLQAHADGTKPTPAGAELLATGHPEFSPVQVEHALPAEPDRLCVFGAPLRGTRDDRTAEVGGGNSGVVVESAVVELRCRVFQPGEDVTGVDQMLGNLIQAVTIAVTDGEPFFLNGKLRLSAYNQDPTAVAPLPEPYVVGFCTLTFQADVVTT